MITSAENARIASLKNRDLVISNIIADAGKRGEFYTYFSRSANITLLGHEIDDLRDAGYKVEPNEKEGFVKVSWDKK